jgi:hypothetical protein
VKAFQQSVPNIPGSDLRITGNAFGSWIEPGVVWVMQDSNGNGQPDDTWHELKGEGVEIMRRYAITYYANGSWQNNLGEAGDVPGGGYPGTAPRDGISFAGTRIVVGSDPASAANVTGYVDTHDSLFDISDAVQADGSPVNLAYIDFVKVQTGEHLYTSTGEKSTEVLSLSRYDPYDNARKLAGAGNGSGGYTYQFVNNSGYELTISVAILNGAFTAHTVAVGTTGTITLSEAEAYFDYSGGSVSYVIAGNRATFSAIP